MSPVRAPALRGDWVGVEPDLRGRVVLLHLLTTGCVNCEHVVDELAPVAAAHPGLAVVGVLSPKFPREAAPGPAARALARLGVTHPVLLDPDRRTWDAYAAKAWPTLVLVDARGYVAGTWRGEGHADDVDAAVAALLAGTPRPAPEPAGGSPVPEPPVGLRHPAALVATPEGTVLVADTGHAAVVELTADGRTELARHHVDARDVTGLALLPPALAAELGVDLVVADRTGHRLHGVSRAAGTSRVLAGTGDPWRPGDPHDGPAAAVPLPSPGAVVLRPGTAEVVVALAGNHTLAAVDLRTGVVRRVAGRVTEGLGDGPAAEAFLAQPSGLAADGDGVWFVDAESSSVRVLADGVVRTLVGEGLFDFGDADGAADTARLQHPEGLALAADGSLLVADTYNGAVRRVDPVTGRVGTVASGLTDPRGVVEVAGGVLVSSGDAVVALPRGLRAGTVRVAVEVDGGLDGGARLELGGVATAQVDGLAVDAELAVGGGELVVTARAGVCAPGTTWCTVREQTWTLPVAVSAGVGAAEVRLRLG